MLNVALIACSDTTPKSSIYFSKAPRGGEFEITRQAQQSAILYKNTRRPKQSSRANAHIANKETRAN